MCYLNLKELLRYNYTLTLFYAKTLINISEHVTLYKVIRDKLIKTFYYRRI